MSLTQERLKELLDYSPETGEFVWKVRRGNRQAGQEAATVRINGYRVIRIDDVLHRAHRLAWLFVYGSFPEDGLDIDHINRVRDDNRISNLRVVTRQVNLLNKSDVKGYYRDSRSTRFIAQLRLDGRNIFLGSFDTEEEAANAYQRAKRELTNSLLT